MTAFTFYSPIIHHLLTWYHSASPIIRAVSLKAVPLRNEIHNISDVGFQGCAYLIQHRQRYFFISAQFGHRIWSDSGSTTQIRLAHFFINEQEMAMSFDLRSSRMAILYYNRLYTAREFRTIVRNSLEFWMGKFHFFTRTALRSTVLGSYVIFKKRNFYFLS